MKVIIKCIASAGAMEGRSELYIVSHWINVQLNIGISKQISN